MAAPPLVIGIVNVTPDSFSDGGRFLDPAAAIAHGLRLVDQGCAMLDIGGESTRPGAEPVSEQDEIARVVPVIAGLKEWTDVPLSVDTMKPAVASAAIAAGATVWNDVSALGGQDASLVAAGLGCGVILMHMQGEPRTMQSDPHYDDVVAEVSAFLSGRAEAAIAAGVAREHIWIDPGIGFGKTLAHNLALLANLAGLAALGFPVVLGASRKSFLKAIDPAANAAEDRLGGSLAAALAGARAGVHAIRAHDVRQTVQALAVDHAIRSAG